MTEHNLIDRYVFEVGNHLPDKMRDDVELELRSALYDMAEERGLNPAAEGDQAAMGEMLKEFGQPGQVARRYRPRRFLVSPRAFPHYEGVLKIVFSVIGGLFGLLALVGILRGGDPLDVLVSTASEFLGSALTSFAIVTLIFYILERSGALEEDLDVEESDWEPSELPEIEDRERIKRGELITEVIFTAAALVVFNFFLDRIGLPIIHNGEPDTLTLFADDLQRFVPMLSVVWAAELALNLVVLNQGRWQQWTRIADLAISATGAYVLYIVVTQAQILELSILDWLVKGALWIALIVSVIELLGSLYGLIFPKRQPPWQRIRRPERPQRPQREEF